MDLDEKSEIAEKMADKIVAVEVCKRDNKDLYKAAEAIAYRRAEIVGESLKDKMIKAGKESKQTELEKEVEEAAEGDDDE